ncbi:DUF418 domain-containing protein [Pelagibacterium halotolerans]|uniref:Putative membrane protein n=1 Tax=Pelagibacterium halotolerans (strain DSM 22347 / JCM 15775 / CGMCC 1.7692 / B2) TaxID=1082931 RepID=G4R966_PELHB|nr:DUF418 domain-containing protein [Pelagibacterium halotolerans]AEQ52446.1 putative membrane protein [Pelagibacterium halotolerans B2]QJR17823.1 DUF418 domain-containing protein [Pelagibacterium halotolerans]SEA36723.1 Uncharacterized membrane protein YeiB [Pelagibacterium halotolerans]
MSDETRPQQREGTRIGGIDAARALAVLGMLMVHVGPRDRTNFAEVLYNLPHGRASILFAFIAGIGMSLLSARPGQLGVARYRLIWMALVLLPLGLSLQMLDHGIAVILHHYAVFYVFGVLVIGLPSRLLGVLAALTTVCGPLAYFAISAQWPDFVWRETVVAGDRPIEIVDGLLLTGPYPLLTWSPALLWGMWVGRLDLRSDPSQLRLLLIGSAVAVSSAIVAAIGLQILGPPDELADWRQLLSDAPHSQMPLWVTGSIGAASAVTGAMLIIVQRWPRLCGPLVALGQLAFSFYVAHLVALHFFKDIVRRESVGEAMVSVIVVMILAGFFAVIWRRHFERGPLETLLVLPFDRAKERRQ